MKYYLFKVKMGHVGRDKYLPMELPICANNIVEAVKLAKNYGGVKRNHKDWCLEMPIQIDYNEFVELSNNLNKDIYWEKHTRSRLSLFSHRLVEEKQRQNTRFQNSRNYRTTNKKETIKKYKAKKMKEMIKSLEPTHWIDDYNILLY